MVKRHKKHMLRASTQGKVAIKAAQEHKKWVWDIKSNREPLVLASLVINPDWNLEEHPQYDPVWADGINEASWKRFLIGKEPIPGIVFQAYCQIYISFCSSCRRTASTRRCLAVCEGRNDSRWHDYDCWGKIHQNLANSQCWHCALERSLFGASGTM
jgi:hypothetical protein